MHAGGVEEELSRNGGDAVLPRDFGILVGVDVDDVGLALILRGSLAEDGVLHLARLAPAGTEVNEGGAAVPQALRELGAGEELDAAYAAYEAKQDSMETKKTLAYVGYGVCAAGVVAAIYAEVRARQDQSWGSAEDVPPRAERVTLLVDPAGPRASLAIRW